MVCPLACWGSYICTVRGHPRGARPLVLISSKDGSNDHGPSIGLLGFLLCTVRGPPRCAQPLVRISSKEGSSDHGASIGLLGFLRLH